MIRINLLPDKKKKRSISVEGEQGVAIGMGILLAAAAAIFFLVHSPMQEELDEQKKANRRLDAENKKIKNKIKDFDKRKAAFAAAQKQAQSIEELNNARSTPANFLFELATILKANGQPSMTPEMTAQLENNENLRWQEGWDPKHVWIRSLKEKEGKFTLLGSAQSDGDVTQLAHRLSASMYFSEILPAGAGKEKSSKATGGVSVYSFKITGKVRY